MQRCPKCDSERIYRSRSRSRWERWRKAITSKRVFRCHACGWRGWGVDSGPTFTDAERELATRALAPEPPNVTTKGLARDANRVDDVPLEALDPVDPPKDSESK